MLRDKETSQLKSMKIYVVYPPYTRLYITQLHVCSCNILGNIRGLNLEFESIGVKTTRMELRLLPEKL